MSNYILIICIVIFSLLISGCVVINQGPQKVIGTPTPTTIPSSAPIPTQTITPVPAIKDVQIKVLRMPIPTQNIANVIYATVMIEVTGGNDEDQLSDLYLMMNGKVIRPSSTGFCQPINGGQTEISEYSYSDSEIPPISHVTVYGQFKDGTVQQLWDGNV